MAKITTFPSQIPSQNLFSIARALHPRNIVKSSRPQAGKQPRGFLIRGISERRVKAVQTGKFNSRRGWFSMNSLCESHKFPIDRCNILLP
ncbi:hypothetical protein K1719_026398 [Acacia pycnantha]|nr:hypothetical protein K1719_026398 [Acacia pycnantha]